MARNRDAVSVKRTGTATEYASSSALHDFEKLKQSKAVWLCMHGICVMYSKF